MEVVKKVEENVFDFNAEDLSMVVRGNEEEDSDSDIELPERLRNKKKNQVEQFNQGDVLAGVAVMGLGTGLASNTNREDNDEENKEVLEHVGEEEQASGGGQGFKTDVLFAKMKFMGASGLVYAGLLEPSDLPPNPEEEEKKDQEE